MSSLEVMIDPLRGLLAVAQAVRGGGDLRAVLEAIAQTLAGSLGYRTVAINVHRAAWDDFEVVVVHGPDEAREALLGGRSVIEDWSDLFHPRFERRGAYLIPHGEWDWSQDTVAAWVSGRAPTDAPEAWHPEDTLLVPLRSGEGRLIGILSVDEPADGRRPDDQALEVLVAVSAHAAIALEQAQAASQRSRHRSAVERLLRTSARIAGQATVDDMLGDVCAGIRDGLGLQRVCVVLADGPGATLAVRASVGWPPGQPALPGGSLGLFDELLAPAHQREGCVLLSDEEARGLVPACLRDLHPSEGNGHGPWAWRRHWLLVPLQDRLGERIGFVWADEPAERLLPTTDDLKALRAFANHAMSALEGARRLADMRHLAEHDPLTGLRNRRTFEPGLEDHLEAHPSVALLVCDLDHFKSVNDVLGHAAGDDVLRRFAALLQESTRSQDLPTRLGGEEFAVVLPDADAAEAFVVAERLRLATRGEFAGHEVPVSVSIGIAVAEEEDLASAATLSRAAHRALYAAKRLGRDRCVVYEAGIIDQLEGPQERDGASREQLAAAILLAETVDLRESGTRRQSQTVARWAEAIARELGWPKARVERVRAAGLLHDIGKLGIPDGLLHKADPLTSGESEELRRHPELGARILDHAGLRDIASWVLALHARMDGTGHPRGLAGEAIAPESRVLAVADAWEAMTATRPYREPLSEDKALAELRDAAGTHFDPAVVRAFERAWQGRLAPVGLPAVTPAA